jgi:hypothetical protein
MNLRRAINLALPHLLILAVDFDCRRGDGIEETHFDN